MTIDQCRLEALADLASNYAAAVAALVASEASAAEARAVFAEAAEAGFDVSDELAALPEDGSELCRRMIEIAEHLAVDARAVMS